LDHKKGDSLKLFKLPNYSSSQPLSTNIRVVEALPRSPSHLVAHLHFGQCNLSDLYSINLLIAIKLFYKNVSSHTQLITNWFLKLLNFTKRFVFAFAFSITFSSSLGAC
jgi:hypothetical protein